MDVLTCSYAPFSTTEFQKKKKKTSSFNYSVSLASEPSRRVKTLLNSLWILASPAAGSLDFSVLVKETVVQLSLRLPPIINQRKFISFQFFVFRADLCSHAHPLHNILKGYTNWKRNKSSENSSPLFYKYTENRQLMYRQN